MKNSGASLILAVVIAGICVCIIPLVTLTVRNDNVVQENVKQIVSEFVTDVKNTGKITTTRYEEFENKLNATGNSYDIDMELKILDENPAKKTIQANYTKIGENVYYSKYKTQMLEELYGAKKQITLKEGDMFYVSVSNQNSTIGQTSTGSLFGFSNEGEKIIKADDSAMIRVNGTSK